jgi:hypothetical protein
MRRVLIVLLTGAPCCWCRWHLLRVRRGVHEGERGGFANGGVAIAKQFQPGRQGNGTAGAWANCQFRFYDDNGPTPHVFTDEEYFLGGIFNWIPDDVIDEFGLTRNEAAAALDFTEEKLFWREVGDVDWTELPITKSTVRAVNSPLFGEVFHVMDHRYHIFEPGTVAPGMYEWKWVSTSPFFPTSTVIGEIHIVDA